MDPLWRNPEFVRHVRSDLRPARMAAIAGVSVLICFLVILMYYRPTGPAGLSQPFESRMILYTILVAIQSAVLCLWSFSSCSQAVASERTLKTFDFIRTTRLTSFELLRGMLFGAPLAAYFAVACTLPFSLFFGFAAGFSLLAIALTYLMLLLVTIVLSLAALSISMTTDKPRSVEVLFILFLILAPLITFISSMNGGNRFPGLISITVVPGLLPLYPHSATSSDFRDFSHVPFFGVSVPTLLVSVLLYGTAGLWLLLMLVRNLKKDMEDIRLLSRWQAILFTAYLNVLVFALLDLRPMYSPSANRLVSVSPQDISPGFLTLNLFIFYAVGLVTLTPPARLKAWLRQPAGNLWFSLSDDGPPWPWMAASAVAALVLFLLEAALSTRFIPFASWSVPDVAARLFMLLVFAVRDVLFLQWCSVKSIKRPVGKGSIFLVLYYSTAFVVTGLFFSSFPGLLTPLGAYTDTLAGDSYSNVVGVLLQLGVCAILLTSIRRRLAPPAPSPAPVPTSGS